MAVYYTFGNATSAIPLSQLDNNFATPITIGNVAVQLGNTVSTIGNVTLSNATISSLSAPITPAQGGTGLVTITANNVMLGNGTSNVQVVAPGTSGNVLTSNGTTWISQAGGGGGGSAATPTSLGTVYGYSNTSITTTYIGYTAGNTSSSGSWNNSFGYNALNAITSGNDNSAFGRALVTNTTGSDNSAFGHNSLYYNLSGSQNTAVGSYSLFSNTGSSNVGIGYYALQANTSGTNNVAIGYYALSSNTTTSNNTAVGYQSLKNTTNGGNAALGYNSLSGVTSGQSNTAVGYEAGNWSTPLTTGQQCIYVGTYSRPSSSSVQAELVLGYDLAGKGNSTAYIRGDSGVYNSANSSSWNTTSDQRLKKNIVDNTIGLVNITQLKVRNFEYRLPEEVDPSLKPTDAVAKTGVQLGFIAQELQQVLPDCVTTESTGVMSVNIDNVIYHMVNAIKELNTIVTTQATTITSMQSVITALQTKVGV